MTVRDISTDEAAKLARETWRFSGMQSAVLKLLYHVQTRDETNANAAIVMIQMVDRLAGESIGASLNEYLLECIRDEYARKILQLERLFRLYRLGLLSYRSGSENIPEDAWDDPSQFIVDEKALDALIRQAHGPRPTFEAVRTLIGLRSGLIRHKTLGDSAPFEECYYPDRFEETDEYEKFLSADKLTLDPETVG